MTFAGLLLILVAIVLAIIGVIRGSDPLLVGSIVASLLTAVTLVVSARQSAAARLAAGRDGLVIPLLPPRAAGAPPATEPARPPEDVDATVAGAPSDGTDLGGTAPDSTGRVSTPDEAAIPPQGGPDERITEDSAADAAGGGPDLDDDTTAELELDLRPETSGIDSMDEQVDLDEDPLDEPPAQLVPPADAAIVAGMDTTVVVVDGRPRYHLMTCAHVRQREVEALPVGEAVELGFTPCSLCEPDTALLAVARHQG